MVVGICGELDNELNYDVSGVYGINEIDYVISNIINLLLGLDILILFNSGCYI